MNNLSYFLKENKIKKQNVKFAPTKSLLDGNGKPLVWEIKHITSKENNTIREECTIYNNYKQRLDVSKYISRLIAESVVYPNLNSKDLQDSYGVMGAEELLFEIVDDPSEYNALVRFIQEINGFDID